MTMTRYIMLGLGALLLGCGFAAAATDESGGEDLRKGAEAHLALLLENAPVEKIEIVAPTYEDADFLLGVAAESYFDRAIDTLGGVENASNTASEILDGWKQAKMRWERYTFFAKKSFVVENETEAKMLGALLANAALIIERLSESGRINLSVSGTAKSLFESFRPDSADSGPLLQQYLFYFQELRAGSVEDLRRHVVLAR